MDLSAFLGAMNDGAIALRQFFIALCSYAVGWFLVGQAGIRLAKWDSRNRSYGIGSVGARLLVGTCFVNAAEYINMQVLTWSGEEMPSANAMSVMSGGGSSVPQMILQTTMIWMATMGVIAIIKGTRLIIKAADGSGQPASMHEDPGWTAAVYIVAGSLGVNLWRFVGPLI